MLWGKDSISRVVESHLFLVHAHLKHNVWLPKQPSRAGEYEDLFQEGVLGLITAARTYDPVRHGAFRGYAVARIQYAVSLCLHEGFRLVRIPATSQKLCRGRFASVRGGKELGVAQEVGLQWPDELIDESSAWRYRPDRETLGDLWMERYCEAVESVRRTLKSSPRCDEARSQLVDRFADEWMLVPESDERVAKRELARQLGCSVGRVHGLYRRYREDVGRILKADEEATMLQALADGASLGWREPVNSHHRRCLRECCELE